MTNRQRLTSMQNAGGNHPAQTVQGILQEGQKSFMKTMDNKLGTQTAPDPFAKKVSFIQQPVKPITPKR